jgi:hypothetical protein
LFFEAHSLIYIDNRWSFLRFRCFLHKQVARQSVVLLAMLNRRTPPALLRLIPHRQCQAA